MKLNATLQPPDGPHRKRYRPRPTRPLAETSTAQPTFTLPRHENVYQPTTQVVVHHSRTGNEMNPLRAGLTWLGRKIGPVLDQLDINVRGRLEPINYALDCQVAQFTNTLQEARTGDGAKVAEVLKAIALDTKGDLSQNIVHLSQQLFALNKHFELVGLAACCCDISSSDQRPEWLHASIKKLAVAFACTRTDAETDSEHQSLEAIRLLKQLMIVCHPDRRARWTASDYLLPESLATVDRLYTVVVVLLEALKEEPGAAAPAASGFN